MAFRTRPHFEDRQFVQYSDESITLSGLTNLSTDAQLIIAPTYLNNLSDDGNGVFTGLTSGSTTITTLEGELVSNRISGLQIQPPVLNLLDISGNTTGTTTVDITGYVLKAFDSGGTITWGSVSSLSADTNTYTISSSLIGDTIYYDTNTTLSAYTTDLSSLGVSGNTLIPLIFAGTNSVVPSFSSNVNTAINSTIAGGRNNTINGTEENFIGSGQNSYIGGSRNFVGGGGYHNVSNFVNTVVGGWRNSGTTGNYIFVGGGRRNHGTGSYSVIGGGSDNRVTARDSVIGGGAENENNGKWSTIAGGEGNYIRSTEFDSFIGGGFRNRISGSTDNVIVGGAQNKIGTGLRGAFIGGGGSQPFAGNFWNSIYSNFGVIVGGKSNKIGTSSNVSFIGGGQSNLITDSSGYSGILGGLSNQISGLTKTFIIGSNITASTSNTTYVNNFSIYNTPTEDNSITDILVRDVDGSVKTMNVNTIVPTGTTKYVETLSFTANTTETIVHNLGVGEELIVSLVDTTTNELIGGTINNFQTNSFDVTLSVDYSNVKVVVIAGGFGNLTTIESFSGGSGNCITDLYVTNIHGCSPITINDTINFNVSGNTFFTDSNSNLDVGVDADPSNGDLFKIYFGTSYFGIRQTGSTNSVESVFLGNDTLGDVLHVTTDGIIIEQELTSSIYDIGTISGSTNLDIKNGNVQMLTLNGDLTLNALSGTTTESGDLTVYLYQDGVGGHNITKGTNILTEGGNPISVTTGATTTDTLLFKTDDNGKYRLISHTKDFS